MALCRSCTHPIHPPYGCEECSVCPDGSQGPLTRQAAKRPANFNTLSPEEQWQIDKELGILDWDGDPES